MSVAAMPLNMPGNKDGSNSGDGPIASRPNTEKRHGLTLVSGEDVTQWSDEQLMARARESHKCFKELVLRYERPIYLLAYGMLNSNHDAEEIAQETFLAVYKNAHVFNPDLSFTSWIYTIASNLSKNVLRRRKHKWFSLDVEGVPEPGTNQKSQPAEICDDRYRREIISQAIASLKPKYTVVLMMRYAEGFSYEQIGEELGLTLSAVDTRLYRAKKLLRKKLQKMGLDEHLQQ